MTITPEISVLMAVYNGEKYVVEAIESILNQTFSNFELIILNDGSTDNSVNLIESINDSRIKLFHNDGNKGLVYTRNKLVSLSNCQLIAVMDCDDVAEKTKLEKQINYLKANPEIKICGTFGDKIDGDGKLIGIKILPEFRKTYTNIEMLFKNQFIHSSIMTYKKVINEFNGYQNFKVCEDFDLLSKISEKYPVSNIDEILLLYREHNQGISKTNSSEINHGAFEIVKRNFKKFKLTETENKITYYLLNDEFNFIDEKEISVFFTKLIEINKHNKFYEVKIFEKVVINHWVKYSLNVKSRYNAKKLLKLNFTLSFKQIKKLIKIIF